MSVEKIKLKHNSPEWLAFRRKGIGASDAAAVLGLSKWTTNVELWEEKVGLLSFGRYERVSRRREFCVFRNG